MFRKRRTERFTRAIDQLGATDDKEGEPKLEIRLGAIYALERIARDSPERDYATIMEVLTAYVRDNAPLPSKKPTEPSSEQNETAEQRKEAKQSLAAALLQVLTAYVREHAPLPSEEAAIPTSVPKESSKQSEDIRRQSEKAGQGVASAPPELLATLLTIAANEEAVNPTGRQRNNKQQLLCHCASKQRS